MEITSQNTSVEVKTFEYEGKIPEHTTNNEEGSNFGLYFTIFLFIVVFFGVIFVQMSA